MDFNSNRVLEKKEDLLKIEILHYKVNVAITPPNGLKFGKAISLYKDTK
jgi:hypothetical protein